LHLPLQQSVRMGVQRPQEADEEADEDEDENGYARMGPARADNGSMGSYSRRTMKQEGGCSGCSKYEVCSNSMAMSNRGVNECAQNGV